MESKRQKQVARLIQKDLGDIFQKEFRSAFKGNFVTITDVIISPDLSVAKVYLSFFKDDRKEEIIEEIRDNTKKIRGMFGAKAGKQLRIIPNFSFFIDDTAEYAQKIEKLFANIHIPKEENDTEEDL